MLGTESRVAVVYAASPIGVDARWLEVPLTTTHTDHTSTPAIAAVM